MAHLVRVSYFKGLSGTAWEVRSLYFSLHSEVRKCFMHGRRKSLSKLTKPKGSKWAANFT